MTFLHGPFRGAIPFVLLSAILHLIAPILSLFAGLGPMLAVIGLVYLAFAYGLSHGMRWLAYIVFVVMFVGLSAAISNIWANGPVPGWLFVGFVFTNSLAILALFLALWKSPETKPA